MFPTLWWLRGSRCFATINAVAGFAAVAGVVVDAAVTGAARGAGDAMIAVPPGMRVLVATRRSTSAAAPTVSRP